ncbi:MAG: ATP synthase F1 subunit gamma [Deltaproteobacteria bacterium]|nr:ATP synthase F1 subunit gamma [Deltaproteobacteria bacterium]
MPSLKAIRKRIASVKSTQKITRAMKMVAGARLNRAQQRILALRPYAVKTHEALERCTAQKGDNAGVGEKPAHPLLAHRPEKSVLMLVLTSDRGLCGAFNTNINKRAEREWHSRKDRGQNIQLALVGRKARDYFRRRNGPVFHDFPGIWEKLDIESARLVAKTLIDPFLKGEFDAIYLVYNEFKSAMTQRVVVESLLPVQSMDAEQEGAHTHRSLDEFTFEPGREALLERLVPMYVEISILRALYESQASEFGARMTAMDSATKNAKEIIDTLTLQYNRARQAAITKELMEILGGAEALKG